jgi:hypothetical protein
VRVLSVEKALFSFRFSSSHISMFFLTIHGLTRDGLPGNAGTAPESMFTPKFSLSSVGALAYLWHWHSLVRLRNPSRPQGPRHWVHGLHSSQSAHSSALAADSGAIGCSRFTNWSTVVCGSLPLFRCSSRSFSARLGLCLGMSWTRLMREELEVRKLSGIGIGIIIGTGHAICSRIGPLKE